jgi:ATP-dependent Clp protease ATP-binding subunit ClpA
MTDAARHLLVRARTEAELLGHAHIGTEHVLLACLSDDSWVSETALRSIVSDTSPMQRALVAVQRPGGGAVSANAAFTEDAKVAVEAAARFAKDMHHSSVGTGHILVGVLDEFGASWAPVIAALGISFHDVYDAVAMLHPTSAEARATDVPGTSNEVMALRQEVAELRASVASLAARFASLEHAR